MLRNVDGERDTEHQNIGCIFSPTTGCITHTLVGNELRCGVDGI